MKNKAYTLAKCILQIASILLVLIPKTLIHEIWEEEGYKYTHKVFSAERNIPFTIFETVNERVVCAVIVGVLLALAVFCATIYILQLDGKIDCNAEDEKKTKIASVIQFLLSVAFFVAVKIPVESTPSGFQYEFAPQASFFYLPILLVAIIFICVKENKITQHNESSENEV